MSRLLIILLAALSLSLVACDAAIEPESAQIEPQDGLVDGVEYVEWQGRIVEPGTSDPVEAALVCVLATYNPCARTDARGEFRLIGQPLGARLALQVFKDGYGPSLVPVKVDGANFTRELPLMPDGFWEGVAEQAGVRPDEELGHVRMVAHEWLAEEMGPMRDMRRVPDPEMHGVLHYGHGDHARRVEGEAWLFNALPGVWSVQMAIDRSDVGGDLLCSASLGWNEAGATFTTLVLPGMTTQLEHLCLRIPSPPALGVPEIPQDQLIEPIENALPVIVPAGG